MPSAGNKSVRRTVLQTMVAPWGRVTAAAGRGPQSADPMEDAVDLNPKTCFAIVLLSLFSPVFADGNADHGKALYQERCTACHSAQYNGVGPAHQGVFGRHAGRAPGFAYSQAVKDSDITWNETTLDRWLTDPEKFIPGQKMGINVPDAGERADLIAYLKTLSAP